VSFAFSSGVVYGGRPDPLCQVLAFSPSVPVGEPCNPHIASTGRFDALAPNGVQVAGKGSTGVWSPPDPARLMPADIRITAQATTTATQTAEGRACAQSTWVDHIECAKLGTVWAPRLSRHSTRVPPYNRRPTHSVALGSGTRLGAYEILSQLGSGGMGEVYRAKDTKLGRDVALKILPATFTSDPDRVARFRREAQVLASLNHPHIGAIYGLDDCDGTQFLVLELVDGESLDKRIARGKIPIDEALAIARQIAEALEAAHEKGIIHRDLKPANIALTNDGNVKVLDFGLAKAIETTETSSLDVTNSPTITTPAMMTGIGMILGTAAYMSPEQAKGRPADKRSDVWAFGCVLYEMLTGKRAFEGEDVSDTLAAVLRGEPAWDALPPGLPVLVSRIVRGSLDKNRRRRIGDVSTIRFLLDEPASFAADAGRLNTSSWKAGLGAMALAGAAAAVSGLAMWAARPRPTPPIVTRFSITLAEGQQLTSASDLSLALSPDGSKLVYIANRRLYLRSMSDLEAQPIRGTEVNPRRVMFSPDGESLAYFSNDDRSFKRIAISGGAPVTIMPWQGSNPADTTQTTILGSTWSGNHIFVGSPSGIVRVPVTGGKAETILRVDAEEFVDTPQMLPDGDHILFTLSRGRSRDRWEKAQIVAQSLSTGARKVLIDGGADGRFVRTGHLVYELGGVLFAVPFDLKTVRVVGGPAPILEGIRRTLNPELTAGAAQYAMSDTGTLAYIPGIVANGPGLSTLAWLDRNGIAEALKLQPAAYHDPRVSPDGRRLAFGTDDGRDANIWVYELSGTTAVRRLTLGAGNNRYPAWAADSRRIAFQSDREGDAGIFWQQADGGGAAERLTKPDKETAHAPESFSPDARWLLFRATHGSEVTLMVLSLDDGKIAPFGDVHSVQPTNASFSPDGKWVAYTKRPASGVAQIYVQAFPAAGQPYQLTKAETTNAHHPFWSRDGQELFFIPGAGQFAVIRITTRPTFSFKDPVALSRGPLGFIEGGPGVTRQNDVAADGRVIAVLPGDPALLLTNSRAAVTPQIQVVLNWFEELKARVPSK
jgi:serine/threonine protein kinase